MTADYNYNYNYNSNCHYLTQLLLEPELAISGPSGVGNEQRD